MFIVPFYWNIRRKGILPIIEATGTTPAKDREFVLLQNAVEIIEKASEFRGIPIQDTYHPANSSLVTVSFSLIFPSDKELDSFIGTITNR